MNPRDALPVPAQEVFSRQQPVHIKHPGRNVLLLSFPALSTDSTGTHYGVLRPLVLNACRVLTNHAANNQGDILATDIEGWNPVPIDDTPLDVDCYYFLGDPELESNRSYPVVKSFSAFSFPRVLPSDWCRLADTRQGLTPPQGDICRTSRMSWDVNWRDEQRCAVTRYRDSTKCARLIPEAEKTWFSVNRMTFYAPDSNEKAGINGPANGILLRADVCWSFDSHAFVFYPAKDDGFVAYFVGRGYSDFPDLFHWRRVMIHPDVPVQFLYARFAYAIINLSSQDFRLDSVPDIKDSLREEHESVPQNKDESDVDSSSASSNQSVRPTRTHEEDDAERDTRWRELLFERVPQLAGLPEVQHPPDTDTLTGCHAETPHMLRLSSEYIKRNPQVWKTSETPEDATREDVEGFYADLLTRPA